MLEYASSFSAGTHLARWCLIAASPCEAVGGQHGHCHRQHRNQGPVLGNKPACAAAARQHHNQAGMDLAEQAAGSMQRERQTAKPLDTHAETAAAGAASPIPHVCTHLASIPAMHFDSRQTLICTPRQTKLAALWCACISLFMFADTVQPFTNLVCCAHSAARQTLQGRHGQGRLLEDVFEHGVVVQGSLCLSADLSHDLKDTAQHSMTQHTTRTRSVR